MTSSNDRRKTTTRRKTTRRGTTRKPKHAVVLSGGGANGAYEIGVLLALVAGKSKTTGEEPLEPDIFVGTSVGAYNAAYLAAHWDTEGSKAVSDLKSIWLEKIAGGFAGEGNGAFRIRSNPFTLLDPRSYVSRPLKTAGDLWDDVVSLTKDSVPRLAGLSDEGPLLDHAVALLNLSDFISVDPLADLASTTIPYDKLRRSTKQVRIAATNWAMGETTVFKNQDLGDQLGPEIIMASAAIPGVFPVQMVGSQPFVDGGILMNSPLFPAIEAGADIIHVITLDPAIEKIALGEMSNTLATAMRQQAISWVKAVEANILRIWAMNRTLELGQIAIKSLADTKINLDMSEYGGDEELDGFEVDKRIWQEIKNYKPLTVYLYRPPEDLGGPLGLLDFSAAHLRRLIERGFKDTVEFVEDDLTYTPPYPIRRNELARRKKNRDEEARLSELRNPPKPAASGSAS